MPLTRREQLYAATITDIKETARQLMRQHGTNGLTLREIARTMGMTAPGLYHYFANRDALITALIIDAFNALADTLEVAQSGPGTVVERLQRALLAYRAWAITNRTDFELIYGNPIPGYKAPRDTTVPAAARSLKVFAALLAEAIAQGDLVPPPAYQSVPPLLAAHFTVLAQQSVGETLASVPVEAFYLAVVAWPRIHGLIMLEIFEHLPPVVGDSTTFYALQIDDMLREFGIRS